MESRTTERATTHHSGIGRHKSRPSSMVSRVPKVNPGGCWNLARRYYGSMVMVIVVLIKVPMTVPVMVVTP